MIRSRTQPVGLLVGCLALLLAAPAGTARARTTWSLIERHQPRAGSPAHGYPVQVYFSKHPESDQNAMAVFPVRRISPTLAVVAFAIRQLVAGPTLAEGKAGYYSAVAGILHGPSSCGGADVRITLNRRRKTVELGTATAQFCRRTSTGGILADVRIRSDISKTLTQFPSIKRVVILDKRGNCFGDLSGRNTCLRPIRGALTRSSHGPATSFIIEAVR